MKLLVLGLCCFFLSLQIGVLARDVSSIIPKSQFEQILKHRNDAACPAKGFYTYEAFIAAARSFRGFGTTGDINTRKREIAAFLAQTSYETTGGIASGPEGPYALGYCIKEERGHHPPSYCYENPQWPCVPGKSYFARGPKQISCNSEYGPAGKAIGVNLLANPDLVATDPVISFKTAIWFWMTPKSPKPSSHDVITGRWVQSSGDKAANRVPGYGLITNIFAGVGECGRGADTSMQSRIGYFRRYCSILGVSPGNNLDCAKQRPFGS